LKMTETIEKLLEKILTQLEDLNETNADIEFFLEQIRQNTEKGKI
jgi:hypothetical protein